MNTIRVEPKARRTGASVATFLLGALSLLAVSSDAAPALLRDMPAQGALRLGEVAYVDDGKCPSGQVKKVTGGNQKTGIARQVECVKRPEGS